MKTFLSKILIVTLATPILLLPFSTSAVLVEVPTRSIGEPLSGEIAGQIDAIAAAGIKVEAEGCATADTVSSQVVSVLTQGLTMLGESTAESTGLKAQIETVDEAILCWSEVIASIITAEETVDAGSTQFGFHKINASKDQALSQIASLKEIRKQLEAREQVAAQKFWKAVLVGLLLKQTDRLAEKLVSELTEKFKINDYSRYISAVADTVYVNSMILANVDNDRDRAIVRSMITNPLLRDVIHPSIVASANAYVAYQPSNLNYNDPNFLPNLDKLGNKENFQQEYQSAMLAKTDEVIAKARAASLTEISQSGGYKSTLNNCGPSISAQQQKDAEYAAILAEIEDRTKLQNTMAKQGNVSMNDQVQIQKDVQVAQGKLDSFTSNLGSVVMQICEGTNTPAAKFKDTIHDLIGSQIKKFSEYNDNNLTFLQRFVITIADNLINKFVFGQNSASTGDLLRESAGSLVQGVAGTLQQPSSGVPTTVPPAPTTTPPIIGEDETSGPPGNVAGQVTYTPSVPFMPRGPDLSFR